MDRHTGLAAPKFWIQNGSGRFNPDDSATTATASAPASVSTSATDQVTKNLYVNVFEVYADGRTKRKLINSILKSKDYKNYND